MARDENGHACGSVRGALCAPPGRAVNLTARRFGVRENRKSQLFDVDRRALTVVRGFGPALGGGGCANLAFPITCAPIRS
eukprot:5071263-Prymnesium_polylepis.1